MSELPSLVRVKRKRDQDPTPDLFLEERSTKRPQTWQFRLQQPHPNDNEAASAQAQSDLSQADREENDVSAKRREFRLAISRERLQNLPGQKRKAQLDVQNIPTFVEATRKRKFAGRANRAPATSAEGQEAKDQPSTALKRPIINAKERQWRAETWKQPDKAAAGATNFPQPDSNLVDALTRFAMEEEARDEARTKPKVTSIPKRPVQRYRDRHPEDFAARTAQLPAQNGGADVDMDMELDQSDDEDYVYDTYVRTREPVMLPTMDNGDSAHDKIGYLVITEQDQPFWETYFEDEASENEFDTDDEDENAEGYYGADYPEDEVASDDEFGRGAYGYRHAASDDEQWDSDTGAWSEEEDTMQNPWKKQPWMRSAKPAALSDDDDDGEGAAD